MYLYVCMYYKTKHYFCSNKIPIVTNYKNNSK